MAEVIADYEDDTISPRATRRNDGEQWNNSPDEEEHPQTQVNEEEQPCTRERESQTERTNLPRRESIESFESISSRAREATELDEIRRMSSESTSEGSLSSGEYRVTPRHSGATTTVTSTSNNTTRGSRNKNKRFQAIRRFWARNITLEVPQKGNRDYFGISFILEIHGKALERTFLAYLRTSTTFSIQGVLVAQLFRLQTSNSQASGRPPSRVNFHSVGVPLSVAYQVCAILVALLGAYRFWRQQNAIARGKVLAGGWELHGIGIMTFLAGVVLLVLAIVIIAESS
ncbi:conserved hypothetical protein [Talaromyces stipitatus ATCC 10500]|uniref:DUF202 domain-containing protein n=1 Tax=Talaromyces stipitatus (strain ATCC 10500 / CBS 375.48 / QM 6759 / NRRL 1006) TaxID=441959 RepID=B8MQF2_TALSN|nr:uncharacterized protein TSTA_058420 [Talaromyces stipitatus ATCC 10500]EED13354.1 conserved hypothetical protein [Talaromyces stipitatus ATCC 10500]